MADEKEEMLAGSVNVPEVIKGLARAVNDTYTYANNSLFGALIPTYYKDYYYRYIQRSCAWLDGFVYSLHYQSGIISTRIGAKLIAGLTKQIVGESLVFKKSSKEDDNEALSFVRDWANKQNIKKAIYGAIGFALGVGTSLLKVNKKSNGDLWLEPCRFDNCFFVKSFTGEVTEATFLIRGYADTRPEHNNQQFILVERRYYDISEGKIERTETGFEVKERKGDRKAMVCYEVYRAHGTTFNNLMAQSVTNSKVNWQELPKFIKNLIRADYSTIKIGEPQLLGFPTIGVECLCNSELDLSVPTAGFGESMLVGIQDDMITYELSSSYLLRDMYYGKGTVYVPKSLSISDVNGNVLEGVGDTKFETVAGLPPEEQKITVEQFQVRGQEWQQIKENCLKNIAVKWGMSPKILSSFLANGQAQMTATQIDSEDDVSIAFITNERSYFKPALNRIIELVLNYYGKAGNVELDFASPSLLNKDRLIHRVSEQMSLGLMDTEEAIRTLYPDTDEDIIKSKIEKAEKLQKDNAFANLDEFDEEGTFKGTTE